MAIPKARTELENYLVYGIDQKNRRIFFGVPVDWSEESQGSFSQASVDMAVRAIKLMESDHPTYPIEIHMNSYGGDAYAMLYLADAIQSSSCQFKFYGGGAIMSAATWIMAICDERNLYPNARIMIHDGWDGKEGKTTDYHIDAKESRRLQDQLNKMYAENSRMPESFWADIVQRDVYLSAEETIKLGLADKIIEPKKRGNLRKIRQANLTKKVDAAELSELVTNIYQRIERKNVTTITVNTPKIEETDSKIIVETPENTNEKKETEQS